MTSRENAGDSARIEPEFYQTGGAFPAATGQEYL